MKPRFALLALLVMALPLPAAAADLFLAQAANFMPAMQEIIPLFEAETGLDVEATYASTGKLYGQIINGAPFDMLLAADEKRPDKLFGDGLAEKPFIYARGQIVLWTLKTELCEMPWTEAVFSPQVSKVAIANTETAPYGTSSMLAMQAVGIWEEMQPKLVFGQSIAQAFQFTTSGAADVGFCAYSSVFTDEGKKGCFTVVGEAPPVIQAACVLKSAPHPEAVAKFVEFLGTDKVQAIKTKYGYK